MHRLKIEPKRGHRRLGLALLVLLVALTVMLFAFTGSAAAFNVLDQQQPVTTGGFMQFNNGFSPAAQTFTPSHTAPLGKISVCIGGWGAYQVRAEIWSTSGGKPYSMLATTQVSVPNGDQRWQDISFPSPPTLGAGWQYAIVLWYVDHDFVWNFKSSSPYSGGAALDGTHYPWGWVWEPFGSYDYAFKTYYYVLDSTPPLVAPPADLTVDSVDDSGAPVTFAASATDDMDPSIPASWIHYYTGYGTPSQTEVHSGDTFPIGTTTVTAAATDSSGNTGTTTFTITVREPYVEVLDQRQEDHMAGLVPPAFTPSDVNAQSFSPGHTGPLTKVSLFISNEYADPYDAQVKICTWPVTGLPTDAQILATSTVYFSGVATDYWQDVTFTSPPTLTAGSQYAIVVTGARFSWYSGVSYLPGWQYHWNGSSWFTRGYRGADFQFRTYSLVHQGTPTDITLDNSSVDENLPAGSVVGNCAATDSDSGDTFAYSLVDGIGARDNALFTLDAQGTLKTATSLNYEGNYFGWIRVRTTDASGLSCEKMLQIAITNVNEPPTDINLLFGSIDENKPIGTCAAWFDTVDPDGGMDTYTYTLVDGEGSGDNALFGFNEWAQLISGAVFDYETKSSYSIRLRSTDAANHSVDKVFTITVNNVNEAPLAGTVSIDNGSPKTNDTLTAVPSGFTDPDGATDLDHYTYAWYKNDALISGETGSTLDLSKAGNGGKGDVITVIVKAVDKGGLQSDAAESDAVTVVNSAPVKGTVSIDNGSPKTNDTLTAIPSGFSDSDGEGDLDHYSYVWSKNDTVIAGETGSTLDLSKADNGDKGDVITVSVKAVDKSAAESDAAVSTGVTIINSAPVLAAIADQSGPFGEAITFTPSATDADVDPITYSLGSGSVGSMDPTTGAYSWTPGPTAIGDHSLSVIASDGSEQDAKTVTITVTKRTATIATCDVQSAVVKSPVKISGSLTDSSGLTSLLVNARVSVTLTPVAGGSAITLGPIDVASDGKFSTSFTTPAPIPLGSYEVCLVVSGASYTGTAPWYDAAAVYDPAAGFASGGGWFLWPGTTQKTTFGFVTNYRKNRTNFKGSLVMVRHLPDGTIYRIKSNAVSGLALSSPTRVGGWASFNGKANYMDPTMSSWLGGYTFNMYAEDNNQPGAGSDKFWIQLMYSGAIVRDCSMPSATGGSAVPAVPLGGGNIVVPHK